MMRSEHTLYETFYKGEEKVSNQNKVISVILGCLLVDIILFVSMTDLTTYIECDLD